jgi:S-formylglutathione hydrolase FrmB
MKFLFLVLILGTDLFAQSTVVNASFYSDALNANKQVQIILPPGYNPQENVLYPVIYFLHGAYSNSMGYPEIISVLNNFYVSGTISEFIVVKPDGNASPYSGSFYTNSELYGNYEDYIVNDVVDFIETDYKAERVKEKRFIAGHSMGAYGAVKIALKHPDKFRGAAGHSGPLDFNQVSAQLPYVLYESGQQPPYIFNPLNGFFTNLFFTMAGAFSPNIAKNPYKVDLPIDENGNFIQDVLAKWMDHNPSGLLSQADHNNFPALYFDCGTLDEVKLYPHNTGFRDSLVSLGLPHRFVSFSGFHSNRLPARLVVSFKFLDSLNNLVLSSNKNDIQQNYQFSLEQNYPNPFNPVTTIKYTVPTEEYVSLKIYNITGKEVAVLTNGLKTAGIYEYDFIGENLSSGIYFARLQSGKRVSVIKMILLK